MFRKPNFSLTRLLKLKKIDCGFPWPLSSKIICNWSSGEFLMLQSDILRYSTIYGRNVELTILFTSKKLFIVKPLSRTRMTWFYIQLWIMSGTFRTLCIVKYISLCFYIHRYHQKSYFLFEHYLIILRKGNSKHFIAILSEKNEMDVPFIIDLFISTLHNYFRLNFNYLPCENF